MPIGFQEMFEPSPTRHDHVFTGTKLFAFFGRDLAQATEKTLDEHWRDGFTLLALDVAAMGAAHAAGLSYTVIDDWISSNARERATLRALECERRWFEPMSEAFTWQGVCWPRLDHHALHWFWRELGVAEELACAFRTQQVQEIQYYLYETPRPLVYYYASDVVGRIWQSLLADISNPCQYSRTSAPIARAFPGRLDTHLHRWLRGVKRVAKSCLPNGAIEQWRTKHTGTGDAMDDAGSYCPACHTRFTFALNAGELPRFASVIARVAEGVPGGVSLALLSGDRELAKQAQQQFGIPVNPGPTGDSNGPEMQQQMWQAYGELRQMSEDHFCARSLVDLEFQFEHFCKQRWPKLERDLAFWRVAWSEQRPEAVIISALPDAESILPGVAAAQLDIPCWTMPHGVIMGKPMLNSLEGIGHLFAVDAQKKIYSRLGIREDALQGCRDVLLEREYPQHRETEQLDTDRFSIVAITDPVGFRGCIANSVSIRAQQQAAHILGQLADHYAESVVLRIKPHPNPDFSDEAIFESVSGPMTQLVLSGTVDLIDLLPQVDLVIAVNYYGSALAHVLRQKKAVIYLCTEPLIGRTELTANALLLHGSGVVATNYEETMQIVGRCLGEPEYMAELRSLARRFAEENLDESLYPSLSHLLAQKHEHGSKEEMKRS